MTPPPIHNLLLTFASLLAIHQAVAHTRHAAVTPSHKPTCPDVLTHIQQRVVNGRPSTGLYHLSLTSPPSGPMRRCTAVRLSPAWGLTAAHCGVTAKWSVLAATVTTHDGLPLVITSVHTHPNYTVVTDRRFDAALLHLSGPPSPTIALNVNNDLPLTSAFVRISGFGSDPTDPTPRGNDGLLRHADIPTVSHTECKSAYVGSPNLGVLDDARQVCAGYAGGLCDACQGDSGGPLVQFTSDGLPVAVGIVSAAAGCAIAGYPGINVRTAGLIDWMQQIDVDFVARRPTQVFARPVGPQVLPSTPLDAADEPMQTDLPDAIPAGDDPVASAEAEASISPDVTVDALPTAGGLDPASPSESGLPDGPRPFPTDVDVTPAPTEVGSVPGADPSAGPGAGPGSGTEDKNDVEGSSAAGDAGTQRDSRIVWAVSGSVGAVVLVGALVLVAGHANSNRVLVGGAPRP